MAQIKWDAYRSLNITNRDSTSMTCVGNTRYGKRCRWDIPHDKVLEIHRILDEFETKAPEKAIGSLKRLARLSLCEETHQNQAPEMIDEWEHAIGGATHFYEKRQDLKEKLRDLRTILGEEKAKRLRVEGQLEAETSRRKQEVKSIGAMKEGEKAIRSIRSKLEKAKAQVECDRDLALSQKDEFKSQLETATKKIAQIELSLQEAENARDIFFEEEERLQAQLSTRKVNLKASTEAKAQLEGTNAALVQEVGTLNAQLSFERHNCAELRISLQKAKDNLSSAQTQLKTVNEELSHNKEELGKLRIEFAKARENTEKEQRKLSVQQEASLARIEDLMQEIAYAKNRPFRTFFVNLLEVTAGWAKSVIACFERMRTRKMFNPATMEENMSSP